MRRVVLVSFSTGMSLDIIGPMEVFVGSGQLVSMYKGQPPGYSVDVAAVDSQPIQMSSGLTIVPSIRLSDVKPPLDTLIVGGGIKRRSLVDSAVVAEVARLAPHARRVASVCTGAFILAEAGLLKGRRVTTHWRWANQLRKRYGLEVDDDRIFIRDHNVWTSAGVTAGMDLALAMVEEDHGLDLALDIARQLVLYLKRPGGQSQFSTVLSSQSVEREALRELLVWMTEHVNEDLSVNALAARVAMSPRNFARTFAQSVGVTPGRFVEQIRVEAARRQLEQTNEGLEAIAQRCGFGSGETMRRAFARQLNVSPHTYRQHFESPNLDRSPKRMLTGIDAPSPSPCMLMDVKPPPPSSRRPTLS